MKHSVFVTMSLFEGGLSVIALLLLSFTTIVINPPGSAGAGALLWGCLAALATYGAMALSVRWLPGFRARLRPHIGQMQQLFTPLSLWQLAFISLLAGVGEELLFRVLLQNWLAGFGYPSVAIVLASLVFAALHWLSLTYFLVTLVVGLAFGIVYHTTQSFVLVASWHGVYDFIALVIVSRCPQWLGFSQASPPSPNTQTH
ncbi:CPBP family intramembrane glutamic endopeptidase [Gilvimarinus algae]|uniref:CPBP family intramembrane metalloprotease n=1 Tax=Gilvimarinus algae TaxID=3058037 RepID=A0ABT8TKF0_9GAMM|nr:CPBP family intramembrane glutamic endopeptidase [Gilvimarinus sp. SDUM040014]MDO3383126.1 CPBP family intramembrane metalloprotease [Gilvimarinus sp. SDUM040014]